MKTTKIAVTCVLIISIAVLIGCTDEAWSRGKPKGVKELVDRAHSKLLENVQHRGSARADIAQLASQLADTLLPLLEPIEHWKGSAFKPTTEQLEGFYQAGNLFMEAEGLLSYGSRPAYHELSKQLQRFISDARQGLDIEYPALGLFISRTLFFFADELAVPAPVT